MYGSDASGIEDISQFYPFYLDPPVICASVYRSQLSRVNRNCPTLAVTRPIRDVSGCQRCLGDRGSLTAPSAHRETRWGWVPGPCTAAGHAARLRTVHPTLRHPGRTASPIASRSPRPRNYGRQPWPSLSEGWQGRCSRPGRTAPGPAPGTLRACASPSGADLVGQALGSRGHLSQLNQHIGHCATGSCTVNEDVRLSTRSPSHQAAPSSAGRAVPARHGLPPARRRGRSQVRHMPSPGAG